MSPTTLLKRPRVVIIGGGFGGLNTALALRRADVDIVLIDRENYHLFQPLLYQVATAGLSPGDIAMPIRTVFARQKNVSVMLATVTDIDRERRVVRVDGKQDVKYDWLVVAAGMVTHWFGNDDWAEHAPGLKRLPDALALRRRILTAFEHAEHEQDDATLTAWMTFVVVGAGATGVEMAGAIRDIAHTVLVRDFKRIDPSRARVILVEGQDRVLPAYAEKTSKKALKQLESLDVDVRLETFVESITEDGVTIDGEFIPTHTVVWSAGLKASPLGEKLHAELDRVGRVKVDETLRVEPRGREFVIGDLANYCHGTEQPLPGQAPVAIQMGKHVAAEIKRAIRNDAPQTFKYFDKGQMATIGRSRAVAEFGKASWGGFVAWLMWLVVHLLFLVGFRNKVAVLAQWIYSYIAFRRSAMLVMGPKVPPEFDTFDEPEHPTESAKPSADEAA